VFVAKFIGAPPMNLFPVDLHGDGLAIGGIVIPDSREVSVRVKEHGRSGVRLGIRAEKLSVSAGVSPVSGSIEAHVVVVEHLGAETIVGFKLGAAIERLAVGAAATRDLYYARLPSDLQFEVGGSCRVGFDLSDAVWFDNDSAERIEL